MIVKYQQEVFMALKKINGMQGGLSRRPKGDPLKYKIIP
jgi:hypothetical protein